MISCAPDHLIWVGMVIVQRRRKLHACRLFLWNDGEKVKRRRGVPAAGRRPPLVHCTCHFSSDFRPSICVLDCMHMMHVLWWVGGCVHTDLSGQLSSRTCVRATFKFWCNVQICWLLHAMHRSACRLQSSEDRLVFDTMRSWGKTTRIQPHMFVWRRRRVYVCGGRRARFVCSNGLARFRLPFIPFPIRFFQVQSLFYISVWKW